MDTFIPRPLPRPIPIVAVRNVCAAVLACALSTPVAASRIVYLAEEDHAYVNELYLADLATPGVTTKLNRPLSVFSEGVSRFAISPDGSRIVYSADQTTAGDPDLYLVDITAPGSWTRLGSLPAGHRELYAKFSPDGGKVAFTASDAFFAETQLYIVDLATPGTATRLNADLADQGAVSMSGFDFTPDGSRVVYVAGELERKFELYAVDVAAPRQSVRLNAPGGSVGDSWEGRFRILPDGNRVVYSSVWQNPRVREVHLVSIDAPGQPVTLNAPFQPNGYVFDFALSPDGHYVTYTADQETDFLLEVYAVNVDA
jgi:Tol biopolymer transport system component